MFGIQQEKPTRFGFWQQVPAADTRTNGSMWCFMASVQRVGRKLELNKSLLMFRNARENAAVHSKTCSVFCLTRL